MNILGNNSSKMNNVIFENRNKNYGAYEIRESYNDSLIKSLLCLSSIVVLIFGSAFAYNKINGAVAKDNFIILDNPDLPVEYVTTIDNTPIPEPVHSLAPAVAPAGAIAIVIKDNVIETHSVNPDVILNGTGASTATGTSYVGPETSTVVAVTPAIVNVAPTTPIEVFIAEEMPEYEGGIAGLMRYITQNIIYPSLAREIGKEGTVHVSFVVNETGNVEGVKVVRGIGYGCDEEVVRVVDKMPRWKKVGKNAGRPVKVRFNIPVSFRIK